MFSHDSNLPQSLLHLYLESALFCWSAWLLPDTLTELLLFDRTAIFQGQYWRLWTAHFTHFTLSQLSTDTAVITALGYSLKHRITSVSLTVAILFTMPLISGLMLWLIPNLIQYRGSSSIASMIWVLTSCLLLQKTSVFSYQFWIASALLFLMITKIVMDAFSIIPSISQLPDGIQVAWQAHAFGAILGLLAWLVQFRLAKK